MDDWTPSGTGACLTAAECSGASTDSLARALLGRGAAGTDGAGSIPASAAAGPQIIADRRHGGRRRLPDGPAAVTDAVRPPSCRHRAVSRHRPRAGAQNYGSNCQKTVSISLCPTSVLLRYYVKRFFFYSWALCSQVRTQKLHTMSLAGKRRLAASAGTSRESPPPITRARVWDSGD